MRHLAVVWGQLLAACIYNAKTKKVAILSSYAKKDDFVTRIKLGDEVCLEASGEGIEIALAMHRRGAVVFLIHTVDVHREAEAAGLLTKITSKLGKVGVKTTKSVWRSRRAAFIGQLAAEKQELFHRFVARDELLAELTALTRLRRAHLKDLNRAKSRRRVLSRRVAQRIIEPSSLLERDILDRYLSETRVTDLEGDLKEIEAMMRVRLRRMEVYSKVFQKVMRTSLSIPADIITTVIDIGRFPSRDKFRMYSGIFPDEQGRISRHRRNERQRYNEVIASAAYNAATVIIRRRIEPFRAVYDLARQYAESRKGYPPSRAHKYAVRRTGQAFIDWIWKEWRSLEKETI